MGMGTTAVCAAITDDTAHIAHVGDSRAYLLRGSQVRQVTRDHTMVNLFVDAELLTPEDAATHPEAHVLSRSLGVERTVEVEQSESVALEAEDLLFLCSDGVHGVITDWELGNVDWGAPHEGISHVLDIVAAREGDDNATAVAVLLATSFEDVPPTAVPELTALAGASGSEARSGATAVPVEELVESGRTIIPDALADAHWDEPANPSATIESRGSNKPSGAGNATAESAAPAGEGRITYLDYDEPAPVEMPKLRKRGREKEEGPASASASPADPAKRRRLILMASAAAMMMAGVGVVAAALVGGASVAVSTVPEILPLPDFAINPAQALMQTDPAEAPSLVHAAADTDIVVAIDAVDQEEPLDDELWVFKPQVPTAPRRLPHRPLGFTQPPPGGHLQW
jgi:hypothetical protein